MHIDIACQHTTLTEGLRAAVIEKLKKLEGHTSQPNQAKVILSIDGRQHVAEGLWQVNGTPYHAKAKGADMYVAIEKMANILDRSMRKAKTSRLSHRAKETIRHAE